MKKQKFSTEKIVVLIIKMIISFYFTFYKQQHEPFEHVQRDQKDILKLKLKKLPQSPRGIHRTTDSKHAG